MSSYNEYEPAKDFIKEHIDSNIDEKVNGDDPADLRTYIDEINEGDTDTLVRGTKSINGSIAKGEVCILENGYGFLSEPHKEVHFYKLTDEELNLLVMNYI